MVCVSCRHGSVRGVRWVELSSVRNLLGGGQKTLESGSFPRQSLPKSDGFSRPSLTEGDGFYRPSPSVGDGLEKPSPSERDGLEKPSLSAKLH